MWEQIENVFYSVLDRPPSDRARFLSGLPGVTADVRGEVERLLRFSETGDRFLEPPGLRDAPEAAPFECAEERWIGKSLGPFRIVAPIAHGGMGSVFLAERADGLFQQRVAVKTLALGAMSDARRGYFDRERRALARLEHPYITRLIDGGASDDGVPYLVMELAEGQTIDEYCRERSPTIADRVRLIQKVCEAVQFAHQNLVVHADLKPRNILVGPSGTPKLLDFGVAKLLAAGAETDRADTAVSSVRPMTPRYAGPELRRGEHATIASDVFSLGVVLREVLVGRPSDWVRSDRLPDGRGLRGDLDAIVAMATDDDPARRYRSVQHLADDLRSYLAHRPVAARRSSARYRFVRLIQRNRAASALVVLVALSLVGGAIGTVSGLRRAERQRDVAVRATRFIETLLSASNPYKDGSEPTILDVLANASSRIDAELAGEPEVEAEVRFAIARTYGGLWQWSDAKPHVERAMVLMRDLSYARDADLADRLLLFGHVLAWNHDDRAESIQREAVAIRERMFGRDDPASAEANLYLAFALWHTPVGGGRWDEAERIFRDAIAVFRGHEGTRPRQLALATYSLSAMLMAKGEFDGDAGALAEESIAHFRASGEISDRYFAEALRNYSYALQRQERFDEETAAIEEYLSRTPASFSLDLVALHSRWRLYGICRTLGDTNQAERWFREWILAECRSRATNRPDDVTDSWSVLGARVAASDAVPFPADSLEAVAIELGKTWCLDDRQMLHRIAQYVMDRCNVGEMELAGRLVDVTKPVAGQETPSQEVAAAVFEGAYGECLLRWDRLAEAKPLLVSGANRLSGRLPIAGVIRRVALERLVRLYERAGEDAKAEVYRTMLVQSR